MISQRQETTGSPSPRARAEAATWLAKLHGNSRNAVVESAWRQWMAEHPEHVKAWELATDAWSESGDLPFTLPRRSISSAPIAFGYRLLLPIMAAAALVVLGVWAIQYLGKAAITTALGEQRTLNLPDGTRVELNTQSRLVVRFDDHARTVVLTSGEAYFNVAHEVRPFVVVAGTRKVIAVGTSFLVRREEHADNAMTVTLIEGRVAVAPVSAANALPAAPTPEVVVLSAGKRFKAAQHAVPTIDTPSIDKETAWMRGQLIFDSTPLRDAAAEFNRYNTFQIRISSREAGDIPVGGVFRTGDSASFAAAVAQAHNLKLITRDNELLLESIEDQQPEEEATTPDP